MASNTVNLDLTSPTIPPGARAVLVSHDESGQLVAVPVARDASVLNIERDLLKHLNETPHTDQWLTMLRDYCDGRLQARQAAREEGSIITPSHRFDWDMTRIVGKEVQHG